MTYDEARALAEAALDADGYREVDACARCRHAYGDEDGNYDCQRVKFSWEFYPGAPLTETPMPVSANGVCDKFEPFPLEASNKEGT